MQLVTKTIGLIAAAAPFLVALPIPGRAAQKLEVPLCPGLTIVTAIAGDAGDYESIKTIDSMDGTRVHIRYSAEYPPERVGSAVRVRRFSESRFIRLNDLRSAKSYLQWYGKNVPIEANGTTGLGISSLVFSTLKGNGEADLGLFNELEGGSPRLSADKQQHPNVFDFVETYRLKRVEPAAVLLPIIVNETRTELPAIHATGRSSFYGYKAEFFFLDDETNPLSLNWRIGIGAGSGANVGQDRDRLNVIKIAYRCATSDSLIERELTQTGRVDVYDIYFSFNSAEIREESEPTLREIANIMQRHPDWKLNLAGHTDAVGSDSSNLDLSRRRADAVRQALISKFGIDATRLATSGYGRSRPIDTNDTEQGRARNRRVELARQ